jgi:hypothetical protein
MSGGRTTRRHRGGAVMATEIFQHAGNPSIPIYLSWVSFVPCQISRSILGIPLFPAAASTAALRFRGESKVMRHHCNNLCLIPLTVSDSVFLGPKLYISHCLFFSFSFFQTACTMVWGSSFSVNRQSMNWSNPPVILSI